jgi:hypothetical protein
MRAPALSLVLLLTAGCNWISPTEPILPQCASPAPFYQYQERAPGYVVMLRNGVDVPEAVRQYEARYRFHADSVWAHVSGFFSEHITLETVNALRCEPDVKFVAENGVGQPGGSITGTAGTSPAAR